MENLGEIKLPDERRIFRIVKITAEFFERVVFRGGGLEFHGGAQLRTKNHTERFTIVCLISAIAFAGLSPFGQALAQFMIV